MKQQNLDLHGSAPDKHKDALLLLDVINDLEFPEGGQLLEQTLPIVGRLKQLKAHCHRNKVPVIYLNDNFGRWQSHLDRLVEHCVEDGVRGQPIAKALRPSANDYFVLKPKHSGFFSTTLSTLLKHLGTERLIVTGVAANLCVLFTVHDAHMLDYEVVVPRDCVASNTHEDTEWALKHMSGALKIDTRPWKQSVGRVSCSLE